MNYVVQQLKKVDVVTGHSAPEDGGTMKQTTVSRDVWVDIAIVEVESRTKRSTVIKKALADAGIEPSDAGVKVRALDVDSAEVHEPKAVQPPPEWTL